MPTLSVAGHPAQYLLGGAVVWKACDWLDSESCHRPVFTLHLLDSPTCCQLMMMATKIGFVLFEQLFSADL